MKTNKKEAFKKVIPQGTIYISTPDPDKISIDELYKLLFKHKFTVLQSFSKPYLNLIYSNNKYLSKPTLKVITFTDKADIEIHKKICPELQDNTEYPVAYVTLLSTIDLTKISTITSINMYSCNIQDIFSKMKKIDDKLKADNSGKSDYFLKSQLKILNDDK